MKADKAAGPQASVRQQMLRLLLSPLLLLLLLLCAAPPGCHAQGSISSLSQLQAAAATGGTYTLRTSLVVTSRVVVNAGVALNLVGDTVACGGLCTLDGSPGAGILLVLGAMNVTHVGFVNSSRGTAQGVQPCDAALPAQPANAGYRLCGAVVVQPGGAFSAVGCLFAGNRGTDTGQYSLFGAALSVRAATAVNFTLDNCTFSQNVLASPAPSYGAAIAVSQPYGWAHTAAFPQLGPNTSLLVTRTLFSGNAASIGGAVYIQAGVGLFSFDACLFSGNAAVSQGVLLDAVPLGGQPPALGGAITYNALDEAYVLSSEYPTYAAHVAHLVSNCVFAGNVATPYLYSASRGGAIFVFPGAFPITIVNTSFAGNTAVQGGGIFYTGTGRLKWPLIPAGFPPLPNTHASTSSDYLRVSSDDYSSNAVFASATGFVVTLSNVTLRGNSASQDGGGVYMQCGVLNVIGGTAFIANTADGSGGGVFVTQHCVTLYSPNNTATAVNIGSGSTFAGNAAGTAGGGVAVAATPPYNSQGAVQLVVTGASFTSNECTNADAAAVAAFSLAGGALDVRWQAANVSLSATTFTSSQTQAYPPVFIDSAAAVSATNVNFTSPASSGMAASNASALGALALSTVTVTPNPGALAGLLLAGTAAPLLSCAGAAFGSNASPQLPPLCATVPTAVSVAGPGPSVRTGAAFSVNTSVIDGYGQVVQSVAGLTVSLAVASSNGTGVRALGGHTTSGYASGVAQMDSLTLTDAPGAAYTLALSLTGAPSSLAGVSPPLLNLAVQPCSSTEVFDPVSRLCLCAAGNYRSSTAAGGSASCVPCAPGSFSPDAGSPAACQMCGTNTYQPQAGGISCLSCPDPTATSPAGSSVLLNCSCPYGTFAVYDASGTTFACAPCPYGALCSGPSAPSGPTALPRALEAYWHAPNDTTTFYDCQAGMCLAEQAGGYPNCREGHTGLLCGECIPDWRIVDGFCESCTGQESVASWPAARREVLAAFLAIIALALLLLLLWWPLLGKTITLRVQASFGRKDQPQVEEAQPGYFALALALVAFFAEPLTLVMESLQIVSSFRNSTRVAWPFTYTRFVGRLSIVNFNFLHLPKSACATPPTDIYSVFDGITLSVTAILLVIALGWALGLALNAVLLRRRADIVALYNRKTTAKVLLLLQLAYAPLAETIISVFACREVAGAWWIQGDVAQQCFTPKHRHYTSLGAFWAAVYVAGIPAVFLAVLTYYRIPAAARYLRQLALLRQTVDIAWQRGVPLPEVNTSTLTPSNMSADHVDALYFALVRNKIPDQAPEGAAAGPAAGGPDDEEEENGQQTKHSLLTDDSCALDDQHKRRLQAVLRWGRKNVHLVDYTWSELKEAEDPRRPGAEQACGELFDHFYPTRWYYKLFETAVKLVLTSVLQFIAPGSAEQVLAGLLISFAVLTVYLRMLPYAIKPIRRIAYTCNLCIFLLLLLAFSIKAGVRVGGSAENSDLFYSVCIGLVIYSFFAVPFGVIANSGFMMYVKHHAKHRLHQSLHIPGSRHEQHQGLLQGFTKRLAAMRHAHEEAPGN